MKYYDFPEGFSECCEAPIQDGICTECGEHADKIDDPLRDSVEKMAKNYPDLGKMEEMDNMRKMK